MIQRVSINPHQVTSCQCIRLQVDGPLSDFPLLSIDRDSYLVGLEIQSGIDFDVAGGRHCIGIGKCCSLADSITFMIDLNHDYASVCQGALSCLQGIPLHSKISRKGSIILQNDVWVGHGATIMAGVTLHNGCVVAAESVVTKDVPPYAVVGGNPAKILRYRFDNETINGLQKIAWWDWDASLQNARRADFTLPAAEFVAKYLPKVEKTRSTYSFPSTKGEGSRTALLIPDFEQPHPLYQKILGQFFTACPPGMTLLIYLPKQNSTQQNLASLDAIFQCYQDCDCDVILQTGEDLDEHTLFQCVDAYITTRSCETVHRTCLADIY